MGYDENTNVFPGHKIVRIVFCMDNYKDLEISTKEEILEEINYFKKINRKSRGNVYLNNFVEALIKYTLGFLQRRKYLSEEGKKLVSKEMLSFEERVKIEVKEPQDDYVGVDASFDGLTQEEIKDLTSNISLNGINKI